MRAAVAATAIVVAPSLALAEWSATLPSFAACRPATRPAMPVHWRAVGLMMPFMQGQVDVAEFVFDATVPAFRASVYGLESGAVDLLITNEQTYRLHGPHAAPTGCSAAGRPFVPPAVQWLSSQAVCVGEAKLNVHMTQWWKMPRRGKEASWHWFRTSNHLPWRTMFMSRTSDPAIIGDYSMTYFPSFEPVAETNLAELKKFCTSRVADHAVGSNIQNRTVRMLMSVANEEAEAERIERIGRLVPGLTHRDCSRMKNVEWPDQFVMTAFISPSSFDEEVNASLIYYDWKTTRTQLALMFQGRPPQLKGLVSLKHGVGYRVTRHASGGNCEAVFPGIVRPNWMNAANCQCRGVIDRHETLSPNRVTQIIGCPIKWQGQRTMWNWYTGQGQPVMFAEAAADVGGVTLADYHDWLPGQRVPPKDFELPRVCLPAGGMTHAPAFSNVSCSDCHTTQGEGGGSR